MNLSPKLKFQDHFSPAEKLPVIAHVPCPLQKNEGNCQIEQFVISTENKHNKTAFFVYKNCCSPHLLVSPTTHIFHNFVPPPNAVKL